MIEVVRVPYGIVHQLVGEFRFTEFRKHDEIFVIFKALTDELQPDTLDRDLCCAADDVRRSGIEECAVAVAAEEIHTPPRVFISERFISTEVELALYAVFPGEPFHDAVAYAVMI